MYFYLKEITLPTIVIFLTIFKLVNLERNHLVNILELKDNLFYMVNEKVHTLVNKLFAVLKLKLNFLKSPKINLLLIMHSDLNNIAVKNFDVYKEMINISKIDYSIDTDDNILKLTTILDQLAIECQNKEIHNYTDVTKVIQLENITVSSSSVESLDFVEDFLRKINTLTENNFTLEHSNVTLNEELDIFSVVKRNTSDLKIWSPPTFVQRQEVLSNLTRRIYKGKRTRIKTYPFMASVHVLNEFMCSGSIISRNLVITAASCLQIVYNNKKLRQNPKNIFIRVGSDYTKRFGETIDIKKLHFHPAYEPFSLKNNLLLLKMAKPIKFMKKKRKIRRILFDKTPERLQDVDEITILGWGATDSVVGAKTPQALSVADISVFDFDNCQEIYSKNYVTEKNFCVGYIFKGGGACKGDVGGPGVVNGILMGVISYGPPVCGTRNMPTVLTKLGYYATWIESVMEQQSFTRRSTISRMLSPIIKEYSTTSIKRYEESYPKNPNYVRTSMTRDYPEEIAILNQILNEVILSNKTLVDDILYGALDNDIEDIFKSSSSTPIQEHPLVNKSLFFHLEFDNKTEPQTYETIVLTTSSPRLTTVPVSLPPYYLGDYEERIKYLQAAQQFQPRTTMSVGTVPPPEPTSFFTDTFGRARKVTMLGLSINEDKEYHKVVSSEDSEKISDNYESNEESKESEGLSIEMTPSIKYSVSKKTTRQKLKRPTGKVITVSTESEVEYEPKQIIKAKRSSETPHAFWGTLKITGVDYKNIFRNVKHTGFVTKKRYKGRENLIYEFNY